MSELIKMKKKTLILHAIKAIIRHREDFSTVDAAYINHHKVTKREIRTYMRGNSAYKGCGGVKLDRFVDELMTEDMLIEVSDGCYFPTELVV